MDSILRSKKLVVLSLLLVGLLALVGCSDDNSVSKHNVSGQVVDADGEPVADVTLKAEGDGGQATTKEDGKWSLTGIKEGTKIVPVANSSIQSEVEFNPQEIVVEQDVSDMKITADLNDGDYQGYKDFGIEYNSDRDETDIYLEFDRDVRPVNESASLADSITVNGTDKDFVANLVELEDGNDGDDNVGDYIEDKGLLISLPGRVSGELSVEIEADTLVNYDDDGNKGERIRAIKTSTVALSSNTNLTEVDEYETEDNSIDDVNTIENEEKVVIVDWDSEDRMPEVRELFEELKPVGQGAKITKIADRIEEDLNHLVTENDTIVVRAEDGTTATYNIQLADEYSSATVSSDIEENSGNAAYTVDNDAPSISSGEATLAWNTTVGEFKSNLNLTSDNSTMKAINIDANITADSFDELNEIADDENLGHGNDENVAAKLAVKAQNDDIKVYDVIVEEPNHTTDLETAEDYSDSVLDIDLENDVVTLRSDLDAASAFFNPLEEAQITNVTNDMIEVTAQDGETVTEYDVKFAPGYVPQAYVDDKAPYVLTLKLGKLDVSIENDEDYLDLEQDILDDFTVTVAGEEAKVLGVDLVKDDNDEGGSLADTQDKAFLRLDTKVQENQEVTVAYQPDENDDPYFISPSGNRILGFEARDAYNGVDAPNYERVISRVNDSEAGTGTNEITIKFDNDITAVGDTAEIAKDFTVKTTKDRDEELISGSQNPDVTGVEVVNENRVELTLDSRILATEKIEVYYEPDYAADDNVLADTDTVKSDELGIDEYTSETEGLDFINYETLEDVSVKGENVVRLFAEGEGTDSTEGKSVPSNVEVPSVDNAYINDGEADDIYVEFDGPVELDNTTVEDVNNWFEISGERELAGVTQDTTPSNTIKLELAEGVNENAGDLDVTYTPKLRTDNPVPAGFLTDENDNKILRNKFEATNDVESASFSAAYVNDQDDQDDPSQEGTTADEVLVEFDEDVEVTDTTGFAVTVAGEEATINSVSASGSDVTLTLDSKVKAEQDVAVSYEADRNTNNLIDAAEINTADNNTEEDVDVPAFDEEVTNNVEAPTFASAAINDDERNVLYLKLTELLDYTNSPDFDFNADYEDDFADDNFTVTVDGQENRVTNSELINDGTNDETADPQIKLTLTNKLTDDDQEVEISYEADDYTDGKLKDSQGNSLQEFSNKEVTNNLATPDFDSAVVEHEEPHIVSVSLDSPDSIEGTTATTDSAIITVNNTEVEIADASVSGDTIDYELATPVETGSDSIEVEVGETKIEDTDGDTVSMLEDPIEATNNVAGPEVTDATIEDNESNEVVVTFDEDLATDGETGLDGAHTTSLAAIQSNFEVTVKGQDNPVTDIAAGASNELVLTLENKVAEGISDVNLEYAASQDLADDIGNKATKDYSDAITNNVEIDTEVDYDASHETTSATAINVEMTNPVAVDGDSANVGVEVIDADGNRVDVEDVATSSSTVEITLAEEVTADQGNLTVYYTPNVQDNLVGDSTDKDPVGKFSVNIENTL